MNNDALKRAKAAALRAGLDPSEILRWVKDDPHAFLAQYDTTEPAPQAEPAPQTEPAPQAEPSTRPSRASPPGRATSPRPTPPAASKPSSWR